MNRFINKLLVFLLLPLLFISAPVYATQQVGLRENVFPASLDSEKLKFQEIASGFNDPVFITNAGDGSGRLFIVERTGKIRIIKNDTPLATPFLDIQSTVKSTGGEQGLLALAFHPAYGTNGEFFVVYTAARSGDPGGSNLILKKFTVSSNPNVADSNSGIILLKIPHPTNSNHNGGSLAFGQDGYLYWSTGDGGSGGDPLNNAQNLNKLLGKILRIDVNGDLPYTIPSDNPFYSSSNPNRKKEIWAYGLRNPWHFSFDSLTGDLYIGDVGQSEREEIDFQAGGDTGGQNYGWRIMEGDLCYNPSSGCDQSGKTLPVAQYDHTLGCAVTGGYVYRGSTFSSLYGYYLYADYCSGMLFSIYRNSTPGWDPVQTLETPYHVSTFGEGEDKELYLTDYGTGKIFKIGYQDTPSVIARFHSNGANDGWILESTQVSNKGGTLNRAATTFALGDNSANEQYRGILGFDTSSLPDNAIITSAVLKIKMKNVQGANPFSTHGGLKVDIRNPYFGSSTGLELGDFQATANHSSVATFNPTPVSNWYRTSFNYIAMRGINLLGTTQFRLRFVLGDNNNGIADYVNFFSGNAGIENQPLLIVTYYTP